MRGQMLPVYCEWYALCMNSPDGTVTHPVLGEVPTCERCARRHALKLKPWNEQLTLPVEGL